jgi:hypothetical protein
MLIAYDVLLALLGLVLLLAPVCSCLFAGSGWLAWASLLVVAGLCVHIKLIQLWVLVTLQFVLVAFLLGSYGDCSHYALFVDAMDSISLGEALSPIAWAICSALYRSSVSMLLCLEEIGGSFLLQIASKWRVQDGDCPSINPVSVVVQAWSSGDDVQIVHYSCVALVGQLVMLCGCFVMVDW